MRCREVLDSYRDAGGRGPARLQIHLSWAPTEEEALAIAHDQWRSNVFEPPVCWDIETVEAFDVIGEKVLARTCPPIGARLKTIWASTPSGCSQDIEQGWDELYLHFVGQQQRAFIDAFGEHVLPQLSPTAHPGGDRMRRSDTGDLWWKNAVFYCADVETFYD